MVISRAIVDQRGHCPRRRRPSLGGVGEGEVRSFQRESPPELRYLFLPGIDLHGVIPAHQAS